MRLRTIALSSCLACFLPERVVLGFASAASVGVKGVVSTVFASHREEKQGKQTHYSLRRRGRGPSCRSVAC